MAINASKVVVGGLAAGVVGTIVGYVSFGLILGSRMEAEMAAVAPSMKGQSMSAATIATNVVTTFAIGILLVWLYAAMRPRFGPGPRTAAYAALAVWICGFIFHLVLLLTGMSTVSTYALASVAALVQTFAAAWVGAMLYTEDAAPVAAPSAAPAR